MPILHIFIPLLHDHAELVIASLNLLFLLLVPLASEVKFLVVFSGLGQQL